ncbi:hypothetical protein Tco_0617963 [Tanacetum coccineum]
MVRCNKCDSIGVIRTSWTPGNPGRRFYSTFFIGDSLLAVFFVNLGVTNGVVGLREGADGLAVTKGAVGLRNGAVFITEGLVGINDGVGLTNVCDWLAGVVLNG